MIYLSGFRFPDRAQEANYMAFSRGHCQTCYDSYYPFGLFEGRTLPERIFLKSRSCTAAMAAARRLY